MKKEYINIKEPTEIQISTSGCELDVGCEQFIVRKMFGPTGFADLRIKADLQEGGWIIERASGVDSIFVEWVRIPAQIEFDYSCEECHDQPSYEDGKCLTCFEKLNNK